jgi:O-antigen ligase
MARATQKRKASSGGIGSLLNFDRMVAGQVILIIYWAGLGIIALIGFSVVGAGVGIAMREDGLSGWLLGGPLLVIGVLVVIILTLLWRAICEFYIAVFRISDDLRALRRNDDAMFASRQEPQRPAPAPVSQPPPPQSMPPFQPPSSY